MDYYFPAYFVLAMFGAALQPKAMGLSVVFALGLVCVYPDKDLAALLAIVYLPSFLLASFRD